MKRLFNFIIKLGWAVLGLSIVALLIITGNWEGLE